LSHSLTSFFHRSLRAQRRAIRFEKVLPWPFWLPCSSYRPASVSFSFCVTCSIGRQKKSPSSWISPCQ
jgi:hypothetical protein